MKELIAAYLSGRTVYELAEIFNCHRTTISNCLKTQGIKVRRQSPTNKQIAEAITLYGSGLSCAKVGSKLGFDPETIRHILMRQGVKLRGVHKRIR